MDKQIKAMFREEARRLVSRDRSARKYSHQNNMSGEITSALVTAYKLGLEHGQNPDAKVVDLPSNDASIAWEMVPPTSRNVLSYMTFSYSRRGREPTFVADELQKYTDEQTGRQRWALVTQAGKPCVTGHTFASKGIGPLLRMELVAPKNHCEERLTLTPIGDATCRLYWARSDRDDPTLPIISMR